MKPSSSRTKIQKSNAKDLIHDLDFSYTDRIEKE